MFWFYDGNNPKNQFIGNLYALVAVCIFILITFIVLR
jgi:hypothetical protein